MKRTGKNVGICGLGIFLPEEVRTNGWWAPEVVEKWARQDAERGPVDAAGLPDGERKVLEALSKYRDDPFKGSVERRVMPAGMLSSDMECSAAAEAIERAGLRPADIDLLLSYSFCPDHLNVPNACTLHHRLGLPEKCFTTSVEGVCNSFLMQLALAEQMICGGRARFALLVQSSAVSRLLPMAEPYSAWCGDGATAVVVGPTSAEAGVLGTAHRTDGSLYHALRTGIPGGAWYDEGRAVWHHGDKRAAFRMLLQVADNGKQVLDEARTEAGIGPGMVDFFASHQATPWFRRVVQEHAGFDRAEAVDTFPFAASLFASNIPLSLYLAERENLLRPGSVVAMYSGGSGVTWSGMVLRWSR